MPIYPTGRCCAGTHCKFPHLELRPEHQCINCGRILHILCGDFDIEQDKYKCKFECSSKRRGGVNSGGSSLDNNVGASTSAASTSAILKQSHLRPSLPTLTTRINKKLGVNAVVSTLLKNINPNECFKKQYPNDYRLRRDNLFVKALKTRADFKKVLVVKHVEHPEKVFELLPGNSKLEKPGPPNQYFLPLF